MVASLLARPSSRSLPIQRGIGISLNCRRKSSERMQAVTARATHRKLWALDFDGVICDSVGESSLTALKAASQLWPEIFDTDSARQQAERIISGMREVRPVVETGYENIVQARLILEGTKPETILEDWERVLKTKMKEWELERADMVRLFGTTRDKWMAEDLEGWLSPNKIYDGVAEPLQQALSSHKAETYIVTTKQARFAGELLRKLANVAFPADRIFSTTESGQPKWQVIKMLLEQHTDCECHFIEDKLSALQLVMEHKDLDKVHLHLVDWGYTTWQELEWAKDCDRIEVIGRARFGELLSSS